MLASSRVCQDSCSHAGDEQIKLFWLAFNEKNFGLLLMKIVGDNMSPCII